MVINLNNLFKFGLYFFDSLLVNNNLHNHKTVKTNCYEDHKPTSTEKKGVWK